MKKTIYKKIEPLDDKSIRQWQKVEKAIKDWQRKEFEKEFKRAFRKEIKIAEWVDKIKKEFPEFDHSWLEMEVKNGKS